MGEDEMLAVKHSALGGSVAAKDWGDALNAIHKYAQASGCPVGADVIKWFAAQTVRYQAEMSEAIAADVQRRSA